MSMLKGSVDAIIGVDTRFGGLGYDHRRHGQDDHNSRLGWLRGAVRPGRSALNAPGLVCGGNLDLGRWADPLPARAGRASHPVDHPTRIKP